jgi:hypothetical protein
MIFGDAEDRRVFLLLFERVIADFRWRCHGYCLMGNSCSRLKAMVKRVRVPFRAQTSASAAKP